MNKYEVIALVGKAGSGKDTILKELIQCGGNQCHRIVSFTTRPKRENEIEGIDYYFIPQKHMLDLIARGEMLECSVFNDWVYGTGINSLKEDKLNIGVFNLDGIRSLSEYPEIELKTYMINATDKNRLLRQLLREENPNIEEILRRFGTDKKDFCEDNISDLNIKNLTNDEEEDFYNCIDYIVADNSL